MDRVLRLLYQGPRGAAPGVVNFYCDQDPAIEVAGGWRRRRRNLERYLEHVGAPSVLLLGEAPGFRGGRFSGIAFTSERQLAGAAGARLSWAGCCFRSTSRRPQLWQEPSSTIVWRALSGNAAGVLLWNAFPWHPHGARGPLSNRAPESAMVRRNLHVLEALLAAYPSARVAAVGRTAQGAVAALGVEAAVGLRHPAHGGASLFRRQWQDFSRSQAKAARSPAIAQAAESRRAGRRGNMHSNQC